MQKSAIVVIDINVAVLYITKTHCFRASAVNCLPL